MMRSHISLWGAYEWDNTLFDGVTVPDQLDKDVFISNLLMEAAELEVIYSDVDFLKQAITQWSASRQRAWNTMQTVLYENYDPFVNIKRDETRSILQNRNLKTKNDGTNTMDTAAWDDSDPVHREVQTVDNTTKDTGFVFTQEHFHVEGDSAITDAQDVAVKEFKLRAEYDLYRYMIKDFISRFCLLVY